MFASAAVIAVPVAANAAPVAANAAPEPAAAPTPSVNQLAGGTTKVVVPLAEPAPIRDAAPLVLSGDTPLGFGVIAADRRSVVVETRARVGPPAIVRISWSGGSVPPARSGRPAAPRAAGPGSGTVPDPSIPVAPTGALPTTVGDPGARGPLPTVRAQYTLGDAVLKVPSGYKVELTGEVTHPRTLGTTRHPSWCCCTTEVLNLHRFATPWTRGADSMWGLPAHGSCSAHSSGPPLAQRSG